MCREAQILRIKGQAARPAATVRGESSQPLVSKPRDGKVIMMMRRACRGMRAD